MRSGPVKRTSVLCLVLLTVLTPAAGAQSNPFGPLPQPVPDQPTVTAPSKTTSLGDTGLKGWQQGLIFGGGAILLAGIAFAIVTDARRNAPDAREALDRERERQDTGVGGSRKQSPQAKARARQKAKVARAARKRNTGRRRKA